MGRIWSPGKYVARPEWYDRNPFDRTLIYVAVVGPHAVTSRGSYTCPAGKKAFIEAIGVFTRRSTAATTEGLIIASASYTPQGGSTAYYAVVQWVSNTVNYHEGNIVGNAGILRAGDNVAINTGDGSTGGTAEYYIMLKITEFDA